jgi:hypothetical protein
MSRIALSLMAILFFLFGSLNAQRVQSEDIHYYLYEYTDEDGNNAAIIFEIASDNPTSPGSEFNKVTAEQLHEKGYRTPTESENEAEVIDKGEDATLSYGWSSWVNAGSRQNNTIKWVECGSKTSRGLANPGWLFVGCTTYVWSGPGHPPPRPVYVNEHLTRGWYTSLTYYREYSAGYTLYWTQKGRHHWGDPRNMRYSSASRWW